MTQPTLFDVCAGKHGGDQQSRQANLKAQATKRIWHSRILDTLRISGGATCKEVAASWNVEMHRISGRITELLAEGKVTKTELIRDGGRVVRCV